MCAVNVQQLTEAYDTLTSFKFSSDATNIVVAIQQYGMMFCALTETGQASTQLHKCVQCSIYISELMDTFRELFRLSYHFECNLMIVVTFCSSRNMETVEFFFIGNIRYEKVQWFKPGKTITNNNVYSLIRSVFGVTDVVRNNMNNAFILVSDAVELY